MNREQMRFVVQVDENGVRTTPRLSRVNTELALLVHGFIPGATPWKLVLDGDGRVLECIGFNAERLQIGRVVGEGVHEFMRALDPQIPVFLDEMAAMLVQEMHQTEIDWAKTRVDFVPLRVLLSMGMSILPIIDNRIVSIQLPGAERGPYKDDVNTFILAMFKEKFVAAVRQALPHDILALAGGLARAQARAREFGLTLPDMAYLIDELDRLMGEHDQLPRGDREARTAWEGRYDALMAQCFGADFPEYALPTSTEPPPTTQG